MKATVEYLIKELVDEPDQVTVTERRETEPPGEEHTAEEHTTYEVRVAPGDRGLVVGKQGRTINALRVLIHAIALRSRNKVHLEVIT